MNQPRSRAGTSFVRRITKFILIVIATLPLMAAAQTQSSAKPPSKKPVASAKHPKVAAGQECADCHAKQNREWEAGPHGQNQVKCLVCHGAVKEGFMARPPVSRCESCHDRQVAQLKTDPFMKAKTCFTCHPPHALKPHQLGGEGGRS